MLNVPNFSQVLFGLLLPLGIATMDMLRFHLHRGWCSRNQLTSQWPVGRSRPQTEHVFLFKHYMGRVLQIDVCFFHSLGPYFTIYGYGYHIVV